MQKSTSTSLRTKKVSIKIIALVLGMAMLVSVAGLSLYFLRSRDGKEPGEANLESNFQTITGKFTERQITDGESAILAVKDVAEDLGLGNAVEELTVASENTVDNLTYYRLQQNYKGIPVYGSTFVVVSDENGEAKGLTGNATDVDMDISLQSMVTQEQVEASIQVAIGTDVEITVPVLSDNMMVIYNGNDVEKPILAYEVVFLAEGEKTKAIIDAKTASVQTIFTLTYANTNYVKDDIKNLFVYDGEEEIIGYLSGFFDDNGNEYGYLEEKTENHYIVVDVSGNKYDMISNDDGTYLILDRDVIIGGGKNDDISIGIFPTKGKEYEKLVDLAEKKDAQATNLLSLVQSSYDYFYEMFGRKGHDNNNGKVYIAYDCKFKNGDSGIDSFFTNGANAYSSSVGSETILRFGYEMTISIDLVAHEYMHSVENAISEMQYSAESGAIMEAYSDLFGELVEEWVNGSCDWKNGERYMKDPESFTEKVCKYKFNNKTCPNVVQCFFDHQVIRSYPKTYQGDHWKSTAKPNKNNDYGGVHTNSTVISHAAYLMTQSSIGGTALTLDELAELWYNTMFTLPCNCSFDVLRQNMVMTARSLEYTDSQIKCIESAFDKVGIDGKATNGATAYETYNVKPTLQVYGADMELYGNYTIDIIRRKTETDNDNSQDKHIKVTNTKPVKLTMREGIYTITIRDASNTDLKYTKNIIISADSPEENIIFATDFGKAEAHVHTFEIQSAPATCTSTGWEKKICACGYYELIKELAKLDHNYVDGKCTMCGKSDEMVAWSGNIDTSWYSETTMEFLISTPEQLAGLAQLVNEGNNFSGILITLDQSMRLNGTTWVPIGLGTTDFAGIFDGNGHVISGFCLTGSLSYAGLFGKISGTIKNLGVENFSIDVNCAEGTIYTGGLVGYNNGAIINCYASGSINATANGSGYVGGLIGINSYGSVINCYANVDVTSAITANFTYISVYVGGLVGNNDGSLMNSYATGDIIASVYSSVSDSGSCYAGGLVGYNESTLENSFATGNVKASSQSGSCHAGGLTGYNSGSITNSYRNEKQQFTVQNKGTVTYESTDTSGSATSIENLQSKEWIGKRLWKNENEIGVWSFGAGYPTLNYDFIKTPIEISTKEQLLAFKSQVTPLSYLLVSDIDLDGGYWSPIENFYGIFDGNGHVISNFTASEYFDCAGFFGKNSGIIKNLGLEDFTVTSSNNAGGLVGENSGIIINCYALGDVCSSEEYGTYFIYNTAGGLVGENYGTIISCYASGNVSSNGTSQNHGAGGGGNYGATSYAGGLVGENQGVIKNCYANSIVTSFSLCSAGSGSKARGYAGGLVGYNNGGSIINAYASGNVNSEVRSYYTEIYVGGLVGYNLGGSIMCAYATSNIYATYAGIRSASVGFGGLIGNTSGTITDSYRYSEQSFEIHEANYSTAYSATNDIGDSKTIEELQSDMFHINTLGWSADIWHFVEGQYPTLKNVGTTN